MKTPNMKMPRLQMNRRQRYTTDELNARLRFYVGMMLAMTVFGATMAIIYAVTFVTQPLGEVQSENDKAFFGLLSTTISFLVGVISGFMLNGTSAAGTKVEEEQYASLMCSDSWLVIVLPLLGAVNGMVLMYIWMKHGKK